MIWYLWKATVFAVMFSVYAYTGRRSQRVASCRPVGLQACRALVAR